MATVKEEENEAKTFTSSPKESNVALIENMLITNTNPKKSMSKPVVKGDLKCECCPYGYHIDLDFVNYCEELYNGTYHQNLMRIYRDHRKHKKSPEVFGLGHHTGKQRSKSGDPPLFKSDYSGSYHERWLPSRSYHSHLHAQKSPIKEIKSPPSDVLSGQKSSKVRNNGECADIFSNSTHTCPLSPNEPCSPNSLFAASRSRSGSNSSLSSVSTEYSTNLHMMNSSSSKCTCGSQQIADTMAALNSASVINNGLPAGYVGINTNVLSTIRSQVATSLHRMKELEEQAKAVPILQVKLSVLKEEKRLLMLQLKHKGFMSKQKPVHVEGNNVEEIDFQDYLHSSTLPRFRKRTFSGTSLEKRGIPLYSSVDGLSSELDDPFEKSNIVDLTDFHSFQRNFKSSDQTTNSLKKVKNVGTNCTVLTRDIGVGHIAERLRSVGIGDDAVSVSDKKCLKCGRTYIKANIHSDSLSSSEFAEDELDDEIKEANKSNVSRHNKNIQRTVEVAEKATGSDTVFMKQPVLTSNKCVSVSIPSSINRCPKCEERSQIKLKNVGSQSKLINYLSSGVNTDHLALKNAGTSTDLHIKCISFGTNTDNNLNDASQITELSMQEVEELQLSRLKQKQMKDKGTGVPRPLLGNAKTQTINPTNDASTSVDVDYHHISVQVTLPLNDENKNKEKYHAPIKRASVKSIQTDFGINTIDASCGNCSIHDTFCNRCELRQMETTGVGSDCISDLLCDRCQHANYVDVAVGEDKPPMLHSVGVNTKERLHSDGSPASGVHICDKCNDKIKSVAKDLVDKNIDNVFHPSFAHNLAVSEANKGVESSVIKHEKSEVETVSTEKRAATQEKKLCRKETLTKLVISKRKSENGGSGSEATDSSDSPSTESPDEKLYDGILNRIISRHREDKPINIETEPMTRKKAELSEEMKKACKILNDSLTSQTTPEKDLGPAMDVIQKEWFHISSKKHSDPHCVEDYLDAFEDISKHLLHTVVNLKDANGNTAMHYAVSHGNFDVVSVLLDSKVCDANIQNKAGYTSVMLISLAEIKNEAHKHVVQRLFQINEINLKAAQNGQTALMLAASQGRTEAVKLLLECGAEINMQDKDGSTALMCAAEHGHGDVVHVLLANPDCDAILVDNDGSSALSIAMEVGHRDVALMIYAKVNFSRGNSPYSSLRTRRTKTSSSSRSSLPPHGSPSTPPRTPPPPSPRSRKNSSSF